MKNEIIVKDEWELLKKALFVYVRDEADARGYTLTKERIEEVCDLVSHNEYLIGLIDEAIDQTIEEGE